MLGLSALYFLYRRCDARLTPSRLWISFLGLVIAGGYAPYDKFILPSIGG